MAALEVCMSSPRNENLEVLKEIINERFARDNARGILTFLPMLNNLDSLCIKLDKTESLDDKKSIVSEMRKEINAHKDTNPGLYNKINERLNGLIMDYALAQQAERKAAEKSQQDADMKARQSVRISGRGHQQQESVFLNSISNEVDGFSANQMGKLMTLCKGLMSAKSPADKHKIIAMIRTELTPGDKNTIDKDLSKRLLTELEELSKNYPQPVQPTKTKSLGFFGKKAPEPEQIKRVKPTPKSAPAEMVTTTSRIKK